MVIAIAHARRDPEYWRERLSSADWAGGRRRVGVGPPAGGVEKSGEWLRRAGHGGCIRV